MDHEHELLLLKKKLLLLKKKQLLRRKKGWWVRPVWEDRKRESEFHTSVRITHIFYSSDRTHCTGRGEVTGLFNIKY